MATLVSTGAFAQVTAASSITVNSASATAGNKLILAIAWIDASGAATTTLTTPTGWTADFSPTSGFTAGGPARSGVALFSKTASAGTNSAVVNSPGSAGNFFSNAIITEWSGMGAFDSASNSAITTNSAAGGTTGATVPNTGTLANANSTAFTLMSLQDNSAGLTNVGLTLTSSGWTQDAVDQDTGATVACLFAHKGVTVNTAIGTTWTWTSSATLGIYQGIIGVYSDAGTSTPAFAQAAVRHPGKGPGAGNSLGRFDQIRRPGVAASVPTAISSLGVSGTAGFASLTATGTITSFGISPTAGLAQITGLLTSTAFGVSPTAGFGGLTGNGVITSLGVSVTEGFAGLAATGVLASLGVSPTAGFAQASGIGSLASLGISATAGLANLQASGSVVNASSLGVSTSVGFANLSGTGVLSSLGASITTGVADTFGSSGFLVSLGVSPMTGEASLQATLSLSSLGASPTAGFADLEQLPQGAFFSLGASVSAGFAQLTGTFIPPPPAPPSQQGGGLVGGDVSAQWKKKPKTAIELERGFRYPWDATGDPIVVSPNITSSSEAAASAHVAPVVRTQSEVNDSLQRAGSEAITAQQADEALLHIMILAALID